MKSKLAILLTLFCFVLGNTAATAQDRPPPNPDRIRSIVWNPDGSQLAYSSNNGLTKIIDTATGEELIVIQSDEQGPTISIDWSPDGSALATGGLDKVLRIWDVKTGQLLNTYEENDLVDYITSVGWSPDGSKIARSSASGAIHIWDNTNSQLLVSIVAGQVHEIDWSHDGTKLAIAEGARIAIWDASTRDYTDTYMNETSMINAMQWDTNSNKIASGSLDNKVIIWNMETNTILDTLTEHTDFITAVAWNDDLLASASIDKTIRIWNTITGKDFQLIQEEFPMFAVAWSPDGSKIAYGGDNNIVKIADVSSLETETTPEPT